MAQPSSMIQVDPGCAIKGPILQSFVWSEQFKQRLERLECEVRHGASPMEPVYGEVSREIISPNTNKARLVILRFPSDPEAEGYAPTNNVNCDEEEGAADLRQMGQGWKTCCQLVTPHESAANTYVDQDGNNITTTISNILHVRKTFTKLTATSYVYCLTSVDAWCDLVSYDEEPETGAVIKITRSVVDAGTTNTTGVAGKFQTVDSVDCYKAIRTTREIVDTVPSGYTTYELISVAFPTLMKTVNGGTFSDVHHPDGHFSTGSGFLPRQKRSVFNLRANVRNGYTKQLRAQVIVDFHSSLPATQSLFKWKTHDLRYNGTLFSVDIRNVLNDYRVLAANTNTADTYYGFAVESTDFQASSPMTASTYIAAIGSLCAIKETVQKWKFNLWRRKTYRIIVE